MNQLHEKIKNKLEYLMSEIDDKIVYEEDPSIKERWNVLYGKLEVFVKYDIQPDDEDMKDISLAIQVLFNKDDDV